MRLYELTGIYADLYRQATDGDGDLPDSAFESLGQMHGEIEHKVEACCQVLRNLESDRDALKAEADRFAKRAKSAGNAADRLKGYVLSCLQAADIHSVEAGVFRVAVAQSPPALKIDDEAVPSNYKRLVSEVDKAAVKAALERGENVPGAALVRGTHLRIK